MAVFCMIGLYILMEISQFSLLPLGFLDLGIGHARSNFISKKLITTETTSLKPLSISS